MEEEEEETGDESVGFLLHLFLCSIPIIILTIEHQLTLEWATADYALYRQPTIGGNWMDSMVSMSPILPPVGNTNFDNTLQVCARTIGLMGLNNNPSSSHIGAMVSSSPTQPFLSFVLSKMWLIQYLPAAISEQLTTSLLRILCHLHFYTDIMLMCSTCGMVPFSSFLYMGD